MYSVVVFPFHSPDEHSITFFSEGELSKNSFHVHLHLLKLEKKKKDQKLY